MTNDEFEKYPFWAREMFNIAGTDLLLPLKFINSKDRTITLRLPSSKEVKVEASAIRTSAQFKAQKEQQVSTDQESSQSKMIEAPIELLDLVRFIADSWHDAHKCIIRSQNMELLMDYRMVQSTKTQSELTRIGQQNHCPANIQLAIDWLLNYSES